MADVVVTMKIMPEDLEVDLDSLEKEAEKVIKKFIGEGALKVEKEPVAFGLNTIKFTFVMSEKKGELEPLEDILRNLDGVSSVEVTDVRRAIGLTILFLRKKKFCISKRT